jgi:hypothetical protein
MAYRIRIARGDYQFEVEGDKKFVLDMLAKHGGPPGAQAPQQGSVSRTTKPAASPNTPAIGKNVSAGEFIRQLGLTKHTDMVLAFGYFLEKMASLSSFTPADINTCYYEAKLENSNTSQMIVQNIRNGRMMPARQGEGKGKKAYTLTQTGEKYINTMINRPAK